MISYPLGVIVIESRKIYKMESGGGGGYKIGGLQNKKKR